MKKICFIIPFFYKWGNYSNVRANYENLQMLGYEVDIYSKNEKPDIDFSKYDLVMLHGSGAVLNEKDYANCNIPIIGFGWSDPNLFNETHYKQSCVYCTNDLNISNKLKLRADKQVYFYNTACDKRHHKDLKLEKTNDILVYGAGVHKFVPNRNEVVDELRKKGFKIKVFGRGWTKHPDTFGFIEGEGLSKEICQSHILLDITNGKTAWGHRVFESSARATPVLTYEREDTKQMFNDSSEIMLYNSFDQLESKLSIYLHMPKTLRQIGLNAQKRCYAEHDISVRIQELIQIIKEIKL